MIGCTVLRAAVLITGGCVATATSPDSVFDRTLDAQRAHKFPNLVYVKVPKTASSTTGGVARRIAAAHGLSGVSSADWISDEPGVWANHGTRSELDADIAGLTQDTFFFTLLRDPVDRCLSLFYMIAEKHELYNNLTSYNKIQFLNSSACRNYQLDYIAPTGWQFAQDGKSDNIGNMLKKHYDVVGIDSLYNESMVLLADKLGVPLKDVLYMNSKVADGSTLDPATGRPLIVHPPLSEEPTEVQDFAASETFRRNNAGDYALVKLVTDGINAELSHRQFKLKLREYTALLATAWDTCVDCCSDVSDENCYWDDAGCGYACLDEMSG